MKIACCLAATLLVSFCSTGTPPGKSQGRGRLDQDYVPALAAVDKFAYAWMTRNQSMGLEIVSPRLKQGFSEETLRSYFSGLSNPHHAAFEIGFGRRLNSSRFAFEIRLYEHYSGENYRVERPGTAEVSVVQVGPEKWLVDDVPGLTAFAKPL